ncbi:MAG TPA: hypothetical protein PLS03_15550 [Terrimicrobiaceae bacterium]|nr:hypothetical protein [Terrimicrobiaceae bacterium]
MTTIFQDWDSNAGNPKGRLLLAFFRLCQAIRSQPGPIWLLGAPVLLAYVVLVEWVMGIELTYKTRTGTRLRLYHGTGLVVHEMAVLGDDCTLRHGVTIGYRHPGGGAPVIGHRVDIGCGAILLGAIHVGDGAVIGAGAVVLHDVPAGAVVAGNPARVIRESAA